MQVLISMLSLPLILPPLPLYPLLFLLLVFPRRMLLLPQFGKVGFFGRRQGVGVCDCASFLQAVDDWVRARGNEDGFGLCGKRGSHFRVFEFGFMDGRVEGTFWGSWKLTWPVAMAEDFRRLDQGV